MAKADQGLLMEIPQSATASCVHLKQSRRNFVVTKLPASVLADITYVSVRGRDAEDGAVQRTLNPMRISSLREYALSGGDYASCIILNWVNKEAEPVISENTIDVPLVPRSAQIIDGQHRVAGLREAVKVDPNVGKIEIPVAIYLFLDTQACADIFLSINTEQKPVAKSLVFDLYGIASATLVDPASVRARDIATALSTDKGSPYYGLIRFPGSPKGQLGVDLSTVVTSVKPLVDDKGVLEAVGIEELEMQTRVLMNYLQSLKSWYGSQWAHKDNVFLSAAGFTGAIDFFVDKLVAYCNINRNYRTEFIVAAMRFDAQSLLKRSDLKGLQGRAAARQVTEKLSDLFAPTSQPVGDLQL